MALHRSESALLVIGENVDRLVSIEARRGGPDQGATAAFYDSAYARLGRPLTLSAAERLIAAVSPGDVVLIATGAGVTPYLPKGETDGPVGAAGLARAIRHGLDARPILLTAARMVETLSATCVAAGLSIHDIETISHVPFSCAVLEYPVDDRSQETADRLLTTLSPKAVVAIEMLAPNRVGVAHSATGLPVGGDRARVEDLFESAQRHGILTIGIGDSGNEIGFGSIEQTVRQRRQWGDVCRCPCGEGMASAVKAAVTVVAGVSNWGAYGVEACLAAILGQPHLIHDNSTDLQMLMECVRTGGVDGATMIPSMSVDRIRHPAHIGVLELLRVIVENGVAPEPERPF